MTLTKQDSLEKYVEIFENEPKSQSRNHGEILSWNRNGMTAKSRLVLETSSCIFLRKYFAGGGQFELLAKYTLLR